MLKTPKLTKGTNFQLQVNLKNGFYGPKKPYFDVSYVNKRQFYFLIGKKPTVNA